MTKELEAFEKIKLGYICGQGAINEFALRESERENFNIVETALKDYEQIEYHNLKVRDFDKKLKALEIIKAHPEQLLDIIDTDNYNEYLDLDYAPDQYLNEENYYLLKEVLL